MSARDIILARVRATHREVPPPAPPAYRLTDGMDAGTRLERFLERLAAYNVHITRLAGEDGIADAVAERLATRGSASLVAPTGLPAHWLPATTVLSEAELSDADLDVTVAVLTSAALAIAETGSIVLDGGAGQGRRAITLLPDQHICVVFTDQIVGLVPEAVSALRPAIDQRRPITFISGPSATADIEFDRVVGVHGPRKLDVLVIETGTRIEETPS